MDKITVEIVRDVWIGPVDGPGGKPENRLRKGMQMEVDLTEQTLSGIESGALKRVKPGDEKAKAKK